MHINYSMIYQSVDIYQGILSADMMHQYDKLVFTFKCQAKSVREVKETQNKYLSVLTVTVHFSKNDTVYCRHGIFCRWINIKSAEDVKEKLGLLSSHTEYFTSIFKTKQEKSDILLQYLKQNKRKVVYSGN